MKTIEVVAAIMTNGSDKILIAKRSLKSSHPGKWEFPGGKIEQNEEHTDALRRELFEEFGIDCKVGCHFTTVIHEYSSHRVHLHAYHANHISGKYKLIDHDCLEWVKPRDMINYNFLEADIPIFNKLISYED